MDSVVAFRFTNQPCHPGARIDLRCRQCNNRVVLSPENVTRVEQGTLLLCRECAVELAGVRMTLVCPHCNKQVWEGIMVNVQDLLLPGICHFCGEIHINDHAVLRVLTPEEMHELKASPQWPAISSLQQHIRQMARTPEETEAEPPGVKEPVN